MRLFGIFVLSLFPLFACGAVDTGSADKSSATPSDSPFKWSAEIFRTASMRQSLNIDVSISNENDVSEVVVDGETQRVQKRRINLLHLNSSRDLGPERVSVVSITVPHQITEDFPEARFRFPGSYDLAFKAQVTVRNEDSTVLRMLPDFNTCSGPPLRAQCTGFNLIGFGHDVNELFNQMRRQESVVVIIGEQETYFELPPVGREVAFAAEMFLENNPGYPGEGISQRQAWRDILEFLELEGVEPTTVLFGDTYVKTGQRFFVGE